MAVTAKSAAKALRRFSRATFIQRSRSKSSEQKAIWHNVTGAGRSGVIREFFAVGPEDEQAVKDAIEQAMKGRIDAA